LGNRGIRVPWKREGGKHYKYRRKKKTLRRAISFVGAGGEDISYQEGPSGGPGVGGEQKRKGRRLTLVEGILPRSREGLKKNVLLD